MAAPTSHTAPTPKKADSTSAARHTPLAAGP